ncbi:MAG: M28 family peptidase [Nocardioidaceae bacterium]
MIIGAHLDTVPQAPGAEDGASGIAVLLEVARIATANQTRLPAVFIAFGGEEPRGDGDDLRHFGSTALVARLSSTQRSAVTVMVALDRGVGSIIPVCSGGLEPPTVRGRCYERRNGLTAQRSLPQPVSPVTIGRSRRLGARCAGRRYVVPRVPQ